MAGIWIAAVGEVNEEILHMIARHVKEMFGLEAGVGMPFDGKTVYDGGSAARDFPEPGFAFEAGRGQYSSTLILRRLAQSIPPGTLRLLAVTEADLFIPMVTFVYGQAQLSNPGDPDFSRGKVAIVSLARLHPEFYGLFPDKDLTVRRIRKEVSHELGHTFGLVHCGDKSCLMSLSTEIMQIDMKSDNFCDSCWFILEENLKSINEKRKSKKGVWFQK